MKYMFLENEINVLNHIKCKNHKKKCFHKTVLLTDLQCHPQWRNTKRHIKTIYLAINGMTVDKFI